jgi:hypothetical protein
MIESLDDGNPWLRTVRRRATEAVIWGMPVVNFRLMYEAMVRAGGEFNEVVFWSGLPDWKNQTLTPNPDTIYAMPFFNTKHVGPVVIEIPPAQGGSITGSVMDAWQAALEDVGPAGLDNGAGGKYLITPPGYTEATPSEYLALPSNTYGGYALLRSNVASTSTPDVQKAVDYVKRVKVYPLTEAQNPSPTNFVDVFDQVFDSTIPYDLRFLEVLHRCIHDEPWLTRDKVMINSLKSIGIAKGARFAPDQDTQAILVDGIAEARQCLHASYEGLFATPYFDGTHWAVPASTEVIEGQSTVFADPDNYPVDGRGLTFSMAFFSAKHLGAGQFYLMSHVDNTGVPLAGKNSYRLTVPPNAPVTLYWSATVYDRDTHALIRNQPRSSRSSQSGDIEVNSDGSIDIIMSPDPQAKEANWIPTSSDRSFEVLFRLYGPQQPLFDKTWQLPDVERIGI